MFGPNLNGEEPNPIIAILFAIVAIAWILGLIGIFLLINQPNKTVQSTPAWPNAGLNQAVH
jgi:uncharacterized membrane protein